jgi:hypothetical protein
MRYESFVVNPSNGTADPLMIYFKAFRGFLGGGLANFQYLSSKPFVIYLQLNECVRFDKPGVYHVSIVSHRVADQSGGGNAPRPVELRSNELAIEIVQADPGWQKEELARIRTMLEQFPPTGSALPDPKRTLLLKQLRYLGSADAAREMARLFRLEDGQTDFECMFGLVGSPNRAAGLEEMRRLLAEPDFPVSETFLSTMSLLSLDPALSNEALPTKREEILGQLRQELIQELPTKTGPALARSAGAAFGGKSSEISPETRQKISRQLIDSFQSLPIDTRIEWLQRRWDDVKGNQWVPLLRQLASQYTDFPVPNEMHAYQSLQLSAVALTNWYELDPEGARPAVITEIERPKPRFSAEVLGFLPDRTLPEAEQTIDGHFIAATDYNIEANLPGLLFRYADADVLPVVLPKIQHSIGNWACAPQKNALAYVLKVDENTAKPLIEKALSAREQIGCWHTVLTDVGSMQSSAALEEFAIDALSDKDAELATDAARYLEEHGSSGAESELWAQYVEWSQKWKSREAELKFNPVAPQTHEWIQISVKHWRLR